MERTKDILLSGSLGYTLWLLLFLLISFPGHVWHMLCFPKLDVWLAFGAFFLIGGAVAVFCLYAWYCTIAAFCKRSRLVRNALYVVSFGFWGSVFFTLLSLETGRPEAGTLLMIFLILWLFFGVPALFSVLALCGLGWLRRGRGGATRKVKAKRPH